MLLFGRWRLTRLLEASTNEPSPHEGLYFDDQLDLATVVQKLLCETHELFLFDCDSEHRPWDD